MPLNDQIFPHTVRGKSCQLFINQRQEHGRILAFIPSKKNPGEYVLEVEVTTLIFAGVERPLRRPQKREHDLGKLTTEPSNATSANNRRDVYVYKFERANLLIDFGQGM